MNCSIVFKVMRGQVLFREDFLQFVDNDGDRWHRGLRCVLLFMYTDRTYSS